MNVGDKHYFSNQLAEDRQMAEFYEKKMWRIRNKLYLLVHILALIQNHIQSIALLEQ